MGLRFYKRIAARLSKLSAITERTYRKRPNDRPSDASSLLTAEIWLEARRWRVRRRMADCLALVCVTIIVLRLGADGLAILHGGSITFDMRLVVGLLIGMIVSTISRISPTHIRLIEKAATSNNPDTVPYIVHAMDTLDPGVRQIVRKAFVVLVPQFYQTGRTLNKDQYMALGRSLKFASNRNDLDFVHMVIGVLTKAADPDAIPYIAVLLDTNNDTRINRGVHEAAIECVRHLVEVREKARQRETLLRPADPMSDEDQTLLRPAGPGDTTTTTLLRPSSPSDE